MSVTVKTKGFQKAAKRMKARSKALSNPQTYTKISLIVSESINKNFKAQGRSPKWKKRTQEYSWPPLLKTRSLFNRVINSTQRWTHLGKRHLLKIIGPGYGFFHQYGCGHLPQRRFVNIFKYERQNIMKILQKILHNP